VSGAVPVEKFDYQVAQRQNKQKRVDFCLVQAADEKAIKFNLKK